MALDESGAGHRGFSLYSIALQLAGCSSGDGDFFDIDRMALGFEATRVQEPPGPVTPDMSPDALARLIS
jgi:hypothetical protein